MSKPTLTLEMVARAVCAIDDYLPNRIDQIEQVRAALAEQGEQEQPALQGDKQLEKQPPTWLCDECRQQWIMADIAPERPRLAQEGPWRVEGGDVRSTLTNDDLSYWIEEPKIEALTLAALLNAGAAAEKQVAELEENCNALLDANVTSIDERNTARAERDTAVAKLRELAGLVRALDEASNRTAYLSLPHPQEIKAMREITTWLAAHPETLTEQKQEDKQ